jgi:hypothetical protein
MRHFIETIHQQEIAKETTYLTRHVEVILAIQESIYKKTEVKIGK